MSVVRTAAWLGSLACVGCFAGAFLIDYLTPDSRDLAVSISGQIKALLGFGMLPCWVVGVGCFIIMLRHRQLDWPLLILLALMGIPLAAFILAVLYMA